MTSLWGPQVTNDVCSWTWHTVNKWSVVRPVFSKVRNTFRARKATRKTPTDRLKNNCKVSCLATPSFLRYNWENYVTRNAPEKFRPQDHMQKEKSSYWSERESTTENFIWSHKQKANLKETTTASFFLAGFEYWVWKILKNIVWGIYSFCVQPLWSHVFDSASQDRRPLIIWN